MKITVVLGSHKIDGKSKEIETSIQNLDTTHVFDFIRLAEMSISPTLTPLLPATVTGICSSTSTSLTAFPFAVASCEPI